MKIRSLSAWSAAACVALFASVAETQSTQQDYVLAVNGQTGHANVVQVNGHSYVDVEALARIANGSIAFQGRRITLTLPGSGDGPATTAPAQAPPGFSKDFLRSGIEYMSQIREWRITLANAIANQYPLSDDLFAPYRGEALTSLRLLRVAASTQADQAATPLLGNEFENMQALTNQFLAKRANLEYIDPDSLSKDAGYQKVLTCARALAAMAAANQFQDDGSCH